MSASDTVVLIHGLFGAFGDERTWAALAPRTVLHPDLLGYGEFSDVADEITIDAQVAHLAATLPPERVHLVGHSVGGVIAAVFAGRHPERVASLTSVEGNVTLADAFWSAELAKLSLAEADAIIDGYRADPAAWWGADKADSVRSARESLAFQPTSTILAMARSVVAVIGAPDWPPLLERLFATIPVHLMAGGTSRSGWNVPDWTVRAAASATVIDDAGHAVMFDQPERFVETLTEVILPPLDLGGVRARVDRLDSDLVALLARREALVRRAGPLKADDAAVRAPGRVEEVIARVRALGAARGASPDLVERIYRGLIDAFIEAERETLGKTL